MRTAALCLTVAMLGACAAPALAQCRCSGCASAVAPAAPQDRPFWDARSGRYLYRASRTHTWYYWRAEQKQWAAVPPTPPATGPASAPAARAQAPYGGQRTCPVMDEELGAHGAPVPVTVRGQTVFVCCRGCVKQVQADPDKYLAKAAAERARLGPASPAR